MAVTTRTDLPPCRDQRYYDELKDIVIGTYVACLDDGTSYERNIYDPVKLKELDDKYPLYWRHFNKELLSVKTPG